MFSKLFGRKSRKSKSAVSTKRAGNNFRPMLESLEGRIVMSQYVWAPANPGSSLLWDNGGGTSNWLEWNGSSWFRATFGDKFPTASDEVFIGGLTWIQNNNDINGHASFSDNNCVQNCIVNTVAYCEEITIDSSWQSGGTPSRLEFNSASKLFIDGSNKESHFRGGRITATASWTTEPIILVQGSNNKLYLEGSEVGYQSGTTYGTLNIVADDSGTIEVNGTSYIGADMYAGLLSAGTITFNYTSGGLTMHQDANINVQSTGVVNLSQTLGFRVADGTESVIYNNGLVKVTAPAMNVPNGWQGIEMEVEVETYDGGTFEVAGPIKIFDNTGTFMGPVRVSDSGSSLKIVPGGRLWTDGEIYFDDTATLRAEGGSIVCDELTMEDAILELLSTPAAYRVFEVTGDVSLEYVDIRVDVNNGTFIQSAQLLVTGDIALSVNVDISVNENGAVVNGDHEYTILQTQGVGNAITGSIDDITSSDNHWTTEETGNDYRMVKGTFGQVGNVHAVDDYLEVVHNDELSLEEVLGNDYYDDWVDDLSVTHINGEEEIGEYFELSSGAIVYMDEYGYFDFTPAPGFVGWDTFSYTVTDGVDVATGIVWVEVTNENPEAYDDFYTGMLNETVIGDVIFDNDYDMDLDEMEVFLINGILAQFGVGIELEYGVLVIYEDGSFDFTPEWDWYGYQYFYYVIVDGLGSSNEAEVEIQIYE